jgi:hypothetical protein
MYTGDAGLPWVKGGGDVGRWSVIGGGGMNIMGGGEGSRWEEKADR